MLVAKCKTDQILQNQVNDLRMSLQQNLSVKKDEKGVQTVELQNMQDMTT